MPAKFRSATCKIAWHGVDATTPKGCSLALGTDAVDTAYLWLFAGPDPDEDYFIGSISMPTGGGQNSCIYDMQGTFVGPASDTTVDLARLADRLKRELARVSVNSMDTTMAELFRRFGPPPASEVQ